MQHLTYRFDKGLRVKLSSRQATEERWDDEEKKGKLSGDV
jgi:hypothetical protein